MCLCKKDGCNKDSNTARASLGLHQKAAWVFLFSFSWPGPDGGMSFCFYSYFLFLPNGFSILITYYSLSGQSPVETRIALWWIFQRHPPITIKLFMQFIYKSWQFSFFAVFHQVIEGWKGFNTACYKKVNNNRWLEGRFGWVGLGWVWLGLVGFGWVWLGLVGDIDQIFDIG